MGKAFNIPVQNKDTEDENFGEKTKKVMSDGPLPDIEEKLTSHAYLTLIIEGLIILSFGFTFGYAVGSPNADIIKKVNAYNKITPEEFKIIKMIEIQNKIARENKTLSQEIAKKEDDVNKNNDILEKNNEVLSKAIINFINK